MDHCALKNLAIKATAFVGCVLAFAACDDHTKSECQSVFKAITSIQPQHLSVKPEFDAELFVIAQKALLSRKGTLPSVDASSYFVASPIEQCERTLALLQKQDPKTPLHELALELLSSYTHLWDPHSTAMSEKSLSSQSGFLTGFGFSVESSDDTGKVEVVDVIAGSPAHAAGLQEGMHLWAINKRYFREISASELGALINDHGAEKLVLGILGSETASDNALKAYHEVTVPRGVFEASPVKLATTQLKIDNAPYSIAYVKIRSFVGAQAFFAEALKTMRASDALVLDLRNISGGDIQAAAEIADLLLPQEAEDFVGLLGKQDQITDVIRMRNASTAWSKPLVVLVNSGTKSAAEILAGALQDYGAVIIGTKTFGKGTRQTLKPLGPYKLIGGMYLTDAFTVRPSGKAIQWHGIVPNIRLPLHAEPKSESAYKRSLPPPRAQPPLPGYKPTAPSLTDPSFQKRLADFESKIQNMPEWNAPNASQEDLQLEAANRAAAFLVNTARFNSP